MGTHTALCDRLGGGASARPRTHGVARWLLAAGIAASAMAVTVPADAAPYPPTAPCDVDAATVYSTSERVGFALSGHGFAPGEDVVLWLGHPNVRAATVSARADGSVRAAFSVSRRIADTTEILTAVSSTASCTVHRPVVPGPGTGSGSGNGSGDGSGNGSGDPGDPQGTGGMPDPPATGTPATGTPATGPGTTGPSQSSQPRSGDGDTTGGASTASAGATPSARPPRTLPPRAGDAQNFTSVTGLSPWLIGGISVGLLVIGLLATRLLTRRSS